MTVALRRKAARACPFSCFFFDPRRRALHRSTPIRSPATGATGERTSASSIRRRPRSSRRGRTGARRSRHPVHVGRSERAPLLLARQRQRPEGFREAEVERRSLLIHARSASSEARIGFEPTYDGFANRCLTTWLPRRLTATLRWQTVFYRARPLGSMKDAESRASRHLLAGPVHW